jgi:hypothetical protein
MTKPSKQITRFIEDHYQRSMLVKLIGEQKLPFTVTIAQGKRRSTDQNRLNRLWCIEISEQLGDQTPEEVRALLKLQFAVPILRAENEAFCERYDAVVKPLPYHAKLALMAEPLDMPCTRLLTAAQETKYLDEVYRYFTERGVVLTIPPDKRFGPPVGEAVKAEKEHAA